ncbi:MAG: hypothetical protein C1943_11635 [Halochromatium sp.]|nr:hypothetical protein [Halochromatium sp.]
MMLLSLGFSNPLAIGKPAQRVGSRIRPAAIAQQMPPSATQKALTEQGVISAHTELTKATKGLATFAFWGIGKRFALV